MGGRVVEGTGLENQQGCKLFVGSNPTPSANQLFQQVRLSPENSKFLAENQQISSTSVRIDID